MRRWSLLLVITCFGCPASGGLTKEPNEEPPEYEGDHPIDEVLYPIFVRDGIAPIEAPRPELCRRIFADLIGRYPSKTEVAKNCEGKTVDEIVRALQQHPSYLLVSERHWRDRLANGETYLDWRYHRELYARIDDLHLGRLRYDDFAREISTHPAFFLETEKPVRAAFSAFLGRPASDAEEAGLSSLYYPWYPGELQDEDFPYLIRYVAVFEPEGCEFIGGCRTELYGGAEIDLREGEDEMLFENMTPNQRRATQAIGELITSQSLFWEAAADEILDRLLGWSDGGRMPRRPGTLLPEVRQVLADHLEATGDYPDAERLVMTSWLYTMPADLTSEKVHASGPLKPAQAEVWLDSMLALLDLDDIGICDVRYTGNFAQYSIYEAFEEGLITEEQMYRDLSTQHRLMEDRRPLVDGEPDETYAYLAGMLGGCPLVASERYDSSGLAFGYAQEALANLLCLDGLAVGDEPLADEVQAQFEVAFGRDPTADELKDFEEAAASCTTGCERVNSSVCIALSGSAEMLFY